MTPDQLAALIPDAYVVTSGPGDASIYVDTGWPAEVVEVSMGEDHDAWDVHVLAWGRDHGLIREDYVGRVEESFVPIVVAAVVATRLAQGEKWEHLLSRGNPDE